MHLIFRTLLVMLRRPRTLIDIMDVGRMEFRVLPSDLDVMGHMNNGVYLSIMDLGRMDLMRKAGAWDHLVKAGVLPVMASETITFRRSLMPWQKFTVETRLVGWDERAIFTEQQIVVGGEVFARATMRGRFVKKTGGVATTAEVFAIAGVNPAPVDPPEWVQRWAGEVALPPTKAPAPSDW